MSKHKMTKIVNTYLRITALSAILLSVVLTASAEEKGREVNTDTAKVDRLAPDFVRAYAVVAEPYDVLYSCFGHAALRLQCPTYGLDYIFTIESEAAEENITGFLMGRLTMRLYALKPEFFFSEYRKQGRGVTQYELNIPPQAKQRLWQQMDERVAMDAQPYDFLTNGCAHLVLSWIDQALGTTAIEFQQWPERFDLTRKKIGYDAISQYPWNRFVISTMVDGEGNSDCTLPEKVIIPADLVYTLKHARVNGSPIIKGEEQVLPSLQKYDNDMTVTPMMIALILLAITLVLLTARRLKPLTMTGGAAKAWGYTMLALQTLGGVFIVYLVVCTSLPGSTFNWLIVPLNPLPLLLWKWRTKWLKPWLVVNILWCIAVLTLPFICEDLAYLPLVLAMSMALFLIPSNTKKLTTENLL